MYAWQPPDMPGEAGLRAQVELSSPMPQQKDTARGTELALLSYEHNLLPFIRAHRETMFTVFFPPYSLLYWADQAAQGELDTRIAQKNLLAGALLEEPNVELYDFQAVIDWPEDYDLYYDLIHYIACVNDAMAFAMAEGTCRVTDMAQIGQNNAALTARVQALFAQ